MTDEWKVPLEMYGGGSWRAKKHKKVTILKYIMYTNEHEK